MLRDSFDNTGILVYVAGIVAAGARVFEQVEAHDFEWMVAKRLVNLSERTIERLAEDQVLRL
ncbi:hypothetical protein BG58_32980 [Caballeronia jiangsuensis]|nr:hypothetical protein BG58_32980 [Caballeronia jiangsuensis]